MHFKRRGRRIGAIYTNLYMDVVKLDPQNRGVLGVDPRSSPPGDPVQLKKEVDMKKLHVSVLSVAIASTLVACGGGGSGGRSEASNDLVGTFEGSLINGARYTTSDGRSGITGQGCAGSEPNRPGCFNYGALGATITFTVGNIQLPPVVVSNDDGRVSTLDVVRALNPNATASDDRLSVLYAALSGLGDSVEHEDGEVIALRPVSASTPAPITFETVYNDIVNASDDGANPGALTQVLAQVTGVDEDEFDRNAADSSEVRRSFFSGPQAYKIPEFDDPEVPIFTGDLRGVWAVNGYEQGSSGGDFTMAWSFSGDAVAQQARTVWGRGSHFPEESQTLEKRWNVFNGYLVITNVDGSDTIQCVPVSVRRDVIDMACVFTELEAAPGGVELAQAASVVTASSPARPAFDVTLKRVNLREVLLANADTNNGTWKSQYEQYFGDEVGTASFTVSQGALRFSQTNYQRQGASVVSDTESGSVTFNGLTMTFTSASETQRCIFAGANISHDGDITAVALRCDFDEAINGSVVAGETEDVLLLPLTGAFDPANFGEVDWANNRLPYCTGAKRNTSACGVER